MANIHIIIDTEKPRIAATVDGKEVANVVEVMAFHRPDASGGEEDFSASIKSVYLQAWPMASGQLMD
ncbi:uncharacterized protein METZ01_LOCUS286623 [marine metagenome]|uniref:Uncharacterized protein n=1 Tax=marine metagenome TaxID=408172 RepID=A0A382LAU3_9ZZZZ|tara:strand:- start:436 stop:636 length:201 start_codon:yes stop_codon:yes gene_type:complete